MAHDVANTPNHIGDTREPQSQQNIQSYQPIVEIQKLMSNSNKIEIQIAKGFNNYIKKTIAPKNKVVIHGTYGGTGTGAIAWMNGPSGRHVATHYVIDENAIIWQLIPQQYFAYHAGSNFRTISQTSFGIQIVNFLSLKQLNGDYYSWTNKLIPRDQVISTPMWRGCTKFHAITLKQHQSLQYLLKYLCQKYGIRKKFYREYNPKAGFNTRQFTGILQHSSFHPTKMDFHPQVIPRISI